METTITTVRTATREYYIRPMFGAFYLWYRSLNAKTGLAWQGVKGVRAGWNCHAVNNHNTGIFELRDGAANYTSERPGYWPESLKDWTGTTNLFRTIEDAKGACK